MANEILATMATYERVHDRSAAASRRALGDAGESLAAVWYQGHGYEVVARNWACRSGEVDLVLRDGRLTVFCEVKSRSSLRFGSPGEAVGPLKQLRLRRLAALWFASCSSRGEDRHLPGGGPVRFDVACVLGDQVEVLEGAF
ncbi:MAG TPA: YraN family protein [Acidimicrobiales bacterium]|nr:YraN family protein [Acidimicrobiales bacterium]